MIKFRVLIPVTIALTALAVFPVTSGSLMYKNWNHHEAEEEAIGHQKAFEFYSERSTASLKGFLSIMKEDPELRAAWLAKDRTKLLERGQSLQSLVMEDLRITHLYFMEPDLTCFLRVHNPTSYGDNINRPSALTAKSSGMQTSGIELGPSGVLVLRIVTPWYLNGALSGFIEAGEDLDKIITISEHDDQTSEFILLKKSSIDRETYGRGGRNFGHDFSYNTFSNRVVMASSINRIPQRFIDNLSFGDEFSEFEKEFTAEGRDYLVIVKVVKDRLANDIFELVSIRDVTSSNRDNMMFIVKTVGIFLLGGVLLTVGFSAYLSGIDRKLDDSYKKLEEISLHDTLTGLYNRIKMTSFLDYNINIQKRYKTPLSILILDLDHFKKVNDLHGHMAGDEVLKETARRLTLCLRTTDLVARFGGEEFIVIAPQTDLDGAIVLARRIRALFAQASFPTDVADKKIGITVSIGVAGKLHDDGINADLLIQRADEALYAAKNGGRNRVCAFGRENVAYQ